jgi:hypothetical protein
MLTYINPNTDLTINSIPKPNPIPNPNPNPIPNQTLTLILQQIRLRNRASYTTCLKKEITPDIWLGLRLGLELDS